MGGYNRYYPASHTLNRDPEFIALRQIYADWMGYVWHEMLAWGDRTGGELKGNPDQIACTLGPISLQKYLKPAVNRIRIAFEYMQERGWIRIELDKIVILNYTKYNRIRESKLHPQAEQLSAPPSFLPILPNQPKEEDTNVSSCAEPFEFTSVPANPNGSQSAPARKQAKKVRPAHGYSEGFSYFWIDYPRKKERYKASLIWEKNKLTANINEILKHVAAMCTNEDWLKEGGRFIPYPATYLNNRLWEDARPIYPSEEESV